MTTAIVGITFAYVALAVLLLNLCFYSHWPVWIKSSAIVITTALYFVTYSALQGFLGWPTSADMPREFIVLSAHVEEPDDNLGIKGGVYLWILAQSDDHVSAAPRAYRLPYSRELHTEANDAMRRINRGVMQVGKIETPLRGVGIPRDTLLDERPERIIIYDLPSPELPDK